MRSNFIFGKQVASTVANITKRTIYNNRTLPDSFYKLEPFQQKEEFEYLMRQKEYLAAQNRKVLFGGLGAIATLVTLFGKKSPSGPKDDKKIGVKYKIGIGLP